MRVFWRRFNSLYVQKGKGINSGTFTLHHGWNEVPESIWQNVSNNPQILKYQKSGIIEMGAISTKETKVPLKERIDSGNFDNIDVVTFLGMDIEQQLKVVSSINSESKLLQLRSVVAKDSKIEIAIEGRIGELNQEIPVKEVTSVEFSALDADEQKTIINGSSAIDSLKEWKKSVLGDKELENLITTRIEHLEAIDRGEKVDPALQRLNNFGG